MYELKILTEQNLEEMKTFFRGIFTKEPWNDDWSDDDQLTSYIRDIGCCFNSICYGFYKDDEMVGLSIGSKRHWWGGTEYDTDLFAN